MKKFLFLLCGAPGVDKLSRQVLSLADSSFPSEEDYSNCCRFSPFYFFLRHPEAGLGRFCKQVCQQLLQHDVAIIEDNQGDIPLLEEIQRAVQKRWGQLQSEKLLVAKYLLMVTDFAICRQGLLEHLGSALRQFELSKGNLPRAALSKQILCQELAQQIYTASVFVSAWETSENREEIISLAQQNGFKSIPIQQNSGSFELVNNNVEHIVLLLLVSTVNQILASTKEQLDNLVNWIPRESILVLLDNVYSETTTSTTSISYHAKLLSHRLNRTVVGIHLWDALWKDTLNLFHSGYVFISTLFSCTTIAFVVLEHGSNEVIDSPYMTTIDLDNILQGRETSAWELVSLQWNLEDSKTCWEWQSLHKLLDNWYLEHQGKSIIEVSIAECYASDIDSQQKTEPKEECVVDSIKKKDETFVNMNPDSCNLLNDESIRQYVSFHPKLIENAQQLLEKHRIQVLFPSFNEAECIMEASQMGSYYHVSFSIQDNPLALKGTHCDCPYFAKQKRTQQTTFLFCKHILALMKQVYHLLTEQSNEREVVDTWKEEKEIVSTTLKSKGEDEIRDDIFSHSTPLDNDIDKKENIEIPTVKPTAPRMLPDFMRSTVITRNATQSKKRKSREVVPVEDNDGESETNSWEASAVNDKTSQQSSFERNDVTQENEQQQYNEYPSKSFYNYLLFGDESDQEEEPLFQLSSSQKGKTQVESFDNRLSKPVLSVGSSTSSEIFSSLDSHPPSLSPIEKNEKQTMENVEFSLEHFLHMDKKPKRSIRDKLASLKKTE